jgi:hypothetical protein
MCAFLELRKIKKTPLHFIIVSKRQAAQMRTGRNQFSKQVSFLPY